MKPYLFASLAVSLLISLAICFYNSASRTYKWLQPRGYELTFLVPSTCGSSAFYWRPDSHFITRYHFGSDKNENSRQLPLIEENIKKLVTSGDSIHKLWITVSDSTPYTFFIKTVGMARKAGATIVASHLNGLYVGAKSFYQRRRDSTFIANNPSWGDLIVITL